MDLQPSNQLYATQHQRQKYTTTPIFNKREMSHVAILLFLLISSVILYYIISPFQPRSLEDISLLSQILPKTQNSVPEICDYSNGKWVRDESYPLRGYTENCPFLDPGFRCQENGRRDTNYQKWRWKPQGCDLPRFNARLVLNYFRNGRIVFAGDSIGRNQWESLICMLTQGVSNQSTIYEEHGRPITKHKGFLSMRFGEYNLTVEYYRVPFLVRITRPPQNSSEKVRGAIRVDKLHWFSTKWVGANLLVFSCGHWWNEDKTIKSGLYFQEGPTVNMTMDSWEALARSLNTLMKWARQNLKPEQSRLVLRSYSPVHYSDGKWNEGGHCETYLTPEINHHRLVKEPLNNILISDVIKQMEREQIRVQYLNITYLTELRQDGHPSSHREPGTPLTAPQDCSHWCLPGVPDTWNELLYAHLFSR